MSFPEPFRKYLFYSHGYPQCKTGRTSHFGEIHRDVSVFLFGFKGFCKEEIEPETREVTLSYDLPKTVFCTPWEISRTFA